jgi:hypothetical protein
MYVQIMIDYDFGWHVSTMYSRGVLLSDTHKQTHNLGRKTSFLRVENMWIIGAKNWTECAQKRRYAARINGNLGHSIWR